MRTWSRPDSGSAAGGVEDRSDPTRPVTSEAPEPVQLEPMGVMAMIDGGLEVVKARPRQLLLAAAVPMVPVLALTCWLRGGPFRMDLAGMVVTFIEHGSSFEGLSDSDELVWFTLFLEQIPAFLVGVMVARAVLSWYSGADPSARSILRDGFRRPVQTFAAFVSGALMKLVGALALCVGAPVMATWLVPLAPVLGVERPGGFAAVRRSWRLVTRRYFSVLWALVLVAVVDQFLRLGLSVLPWMLGGSLPDEVGSVIRWASTLGAGVFSAVFVAATSMVVYFDLRIRTEGLDIELGITKAYPSEG